MSSFIGHALVGSAIAVGNREINSIKALIITVFFAGLAMSPDIDYIIRWVFKYRIEPRYTHSIGYCFIISLFAVSIKLFVLKNTLNEIPIILFFIATFSHLALDLLVGVYPMPLFFPINDTLIVLPFGIFPSAGRINIHNFYFWRNLLIEQGILIPIIALIIPKYRRVLLQKYQIYGFILLIIFFINVYIGLNLQR